jgi:hypothetical protein
VGPKPPPDTLCQLTGVLSAGSVRRIGLISGHDRVIHHARGWRCGMGGYGFLLFILLRQVSAHRSDPSSPHNQGQ